MNTHAIDAVQLVPATTGDIDFLFALKSQPDSVRWGGFAAPPMYASLRQHYEGILAGGAKKTLIVRVGDRAAGVIGYRIAGGPLCTDFSINVSSEFTGRGVGRAALELHAEHLRVDEPDCRLVVAQIRADNLRSQRVFERCGYAPTGDVEARFLDSEGALVLLQTWARTLP